MICHSANESLILSDRREHQYANVIMDKFRYINNNNNNNNNDRLTAFDLGQPG